VLDPRELDGQLRLGLRTQNLRPLGRGGVGSIVPPVEGGGSQPRHGPTGFRVPRGPPRNGPPHRRRHRP
jgi:hypothetical protein